MSLYLAYLSIPTLQCNVQACTSFAVNDKWVNLLKSHAVLARCGVPGLPTIFKAPSAQAATLRAKPAMPFRSSFFALFRDSFSPHSRGSSCPIDDELYRHYPNTHIDWLELRKGREEPQHEFIILRTNNGFYRIERRPLEGATLGSKWYGCEAEDTITHLEQQEDYRRVWASADIKILVAFYHDPKPDLHSIFAFCDAICHDPDVEKYTLLQFNCYFFARTLVLFVARHFLLRQHCRRESPRNDFAKLTGSEIDVIVDQVVNRAMNIWISYTVGDVSVMFWLGNARITYYHSI